MEEFTIVMDKEKCRMDLLTMSDPSLPQVMRQLNLCTAFAGLLGDKNIAVCLLEQRGDFYEVVNFAVDTFYQGRGFGKEILYYVLDYVKAMGGTAVEIGAGNAKIQLFGMLQKLGFRVVAVWPDHYYEDYRQASVENSIFNRDMIRYRMDLTTRK